MEYTKNKLTKAISSISNGKRVSLYLQVYGLKKEQAKNRCHFEWNPDVSNIKGTEVNSVCVSLSSTSSEQGRMRGQ